VENHSWRIGDVTSLGNNPMKVLKLAALKFGILLARERERSV
jgi:hypothetical protein